MLRALGFRIEDVKLVVNSRVHFDHGGGISELQRLSGAEVAASPWSAEVLTRRRASARATHSSAAPPLIVESLGNYSFKDSKKDISIVYRKLRGNWYPYYEVSG